MNHTQPWIPALEHVVARRFSDLGWLRVRSPLDASLSGAGCDSAQAGAA